MKVRILTLAILCTACVPALREPPPLPSEGHTPPAGRESGSGNEIEEARRLYAVRQVETVREAASLLEGTAADPVLAPEAIRLLAQTRIWLAGHEDGAEARKAAATGAVHAGQWCRKLEPESAECAYWLGAALGVQARERRGTALDALPRIEELFLEARRGDPGLDRAGPDRALALLYVRAPGWPSGPGDPDLGLEHAGMASEREPEYPPNMLALAEALAAVDEPRDSRQAYERGLALALQWAERGSGDAAEWIEEARRGLGRLDR